jgi:Protein of unknown function (DUF4244)
MPDPTRRLPQHRPQSPQSPRRRDSGQTTAEYALVILAAGTLALAAILWARDSGSITDLFQEVVDRLTGDL